MNERFEEELKWAFRRREPPTGFTERVLARTTPSRESARHKGWLSSLFSAYKWVPAMAACLVVILMAGTWEYRRLEQRRQAEQTKQELMFALQVTSAKLERTRTKLLQNVGGML